MKKVVLLVLGGLLLTGMIGSDISFAEEAKEVEELKARVEKLEQGVLGKWADRFHIKSLLEVEGFYSKTDLADGGNEDESDIVLATAELDIGIDLHKYVQGQINLLWEEDDTEPVDLDVGTITIGEYKGVSLTAGKMYLPFGVFNSHFISDPITLELGETRETALLVAYNHDLFNIQAGVFNGDVEEAGEDNYIDDVVLSLEVTPGEDITFGVSYISDIADTDGELTGGSNYKHQVGGFSAFVSVALGPVTLEAEYLGAIDDFDPADLDGDGDGNGDKPKAWNIEAAYGVSEKLELALRYEGTDEYFDFPEDQYGAAASYQIWEAVTASLEYLHGEFDNDDEIDIVTTQLAIEF